jgi:glucose-1-phosphate cytidylyltransferase
VRLIILAGGRGTRLAEETHLVPKPMVEIKGKPILWHIMNIFAKQGFQDFLISTGYLSEVIESWAQNANEPWNIETIFTGLDTQTGGRIRQSLMATGDKQCFATYGDGLANIDLNQIIKLHKSQNFIATLTAVRPPARFGVVELSNNTVTHFGEKLQADAGWINGGFFMLNREVVDYIHSDDEPFESGALPRLSREGKLGAYTHEGFWKPMDTLREKIEFQELAKENPWPWIQNI